MAYEATLIVETELPINFTCSNTVGIEKGTILTMSDPMTAAACVGDEDIVAGIAAAEKIANDGATKIPVYRGGIFKVYASGSIAVGDALITASALTDSRNFVKSAGVNGEDIIGIALETASDEESFLMELKPFTMNLA